MNRIALIKQARILAWGIFIAGIALTAALASNPFFNDFTVATLIIIWVVLLFTLPNIYAKKKYKKIQNIFREECDPQKYIEEMEKLLKEDMDRNMRISLELEICYAYMEWGNYTIAKEILNLIDNLIMLLGNSSLRSVHQSYANALNLRKGNYDGLEQYYENEFESSKDMLSKIFIKMKLGKIYLYYKKTAEAKEAFEYVIQHGNKLYKVQEAEKYLEQLS